MSSQQILEPPLQQRYNPSKEEEPDSETGKVKSIPGALAYRSSIEPVIDDVFEIFAGPNLTHEPILVTIHTGELADMIENVVNSIS
jgi:hypothetical protein